jgi:hypothetical protein
MCQRWYLRNARVDTLPAEFDPNVAGERIFVCIRNIATFASATRARNSGCPYSRDLDSRRVTFCAGTHGREHLYPSISNPLPNGVA